jgi:integrative and conjugative element protein (TIGR02256 family)
MRFGRPGGGELRLSEATLRMRVHVQRYCWSSEAGGILLGRMLMASDHIVVDDVTVPGPHDRRSRFRFFRAERPAQTAVDAAWARSGGEINYLGEWHTHPEDDPTPSRHDHTDWQRLVMTQRYEQAALFFVIVGRREIRAWELARGRAVVVPLPLLGEGSDDGERDGGVQR